MSSWCMSFHVYDIHILLSICFGVAHLSFGALLFQVQWLIKLSEIPEVEEVPSFSDDARSFLQGIVDGFGKDDALEVKEIEQVTNHDVKAVEYFLKKKCESHPEIVKVSDRALLIFSSPSSLKFWNYVPTYFLIAGA